MIHRLLNVFQHDGALRISDVLNLLNANLQVRLQKFAQSPVIAAQQLDLALMGR